MSNWVSVSSSNLSEVRYDEVTSTLGVRFLNGSEYEYYDVFSDDYYNLIGAPSAGQYFNAHIKSIYRYSRIY